MKRPGFVFLVFLAWSAGLNAQYNDSIQYNLGLTSTGTYNKTNLNSSYLLNNSFKAGVKRKAVTLNASCRHLWGEQQNRLVNNDLTSVLEFNLYKTLPHFYYWVLFNYNKVYSLRINHQLQTGAGLAYNIIDRPAFQLNVSDGVVYDYSDMFLADFDREVYRTTRNSARLQVKSNFKNLIILKVYGMLQNSLDYPGDYIVRSETSVSLKLIKWLNVIARANYNKYSRNGRENLFMTYGLSLDKYF